MEQFARGENTMTTKKAKKPSKHLRKAKKLAPTKPLSTIPVDPCKL
jgi:hypothetical protein